MTNRTFQVWSSNHHGSTSCLQPVTTRIWATVGHSDACCPGTTTGGASSKVNDNVQVQQLCLAGANYHDTEPSTKNRNMPQNHHRKKKKSIKRGRSQSYSQRPNALVEWQPYTCLTTRGESKRPSVKLPPTFFLPLRQLICFRSQDTQFTVALTPKWGSQTSQTYVQYRDMEQ